MFRKKVVPRCRLKKHISPNIHSEWISLKLICYFCSLLFLIERGSIFEPVKNDYSNGKHCYSPFYN